MKLHAFALSLLVLVGACVTTDPEPNAADQLGVSLLEKSGGFTIDHFGKSLAESGLFAVSPYPERGEKFDRMPTALDIARFREKNGDLLERPKRNVGGWCEGKGNTPPCYLDVSVTVADEAKAVMIGKSCNQQSVAQLVREVRLISTGGDGSSISGEQLQVCRRTLAQVLGG